jgi:hypothetical protein
MRAGVRSNPYPCRDFSNSIIGRTNGESS